MKTWNEIKHKNMTNERIANLESYSIELSPLQKDIVSMIAHCIPCTMELLLIYHRDLDEEGLGIILQGLERDGWIESYELEGEICYRANDPWMGNSWTGIK